MITPSFGITATQRVFPSFALDFTTASLDPRITFTRTTGASNPATYTNSSGTITAATNDQPRFNYDPVSLVCKGLLIEESRTNAIKYSEQINNAAWTKTNATITADTVTAPDGTSTGDKLIATAVNGGHLILQSPTASSTVTGSFYIKVGEYSSGYMQFLDGTINLYCYFNASTQSTNAINYGSGSPTTTLSITPAGNGWYRCVASVSGIGTLSANGFRIGISTGTAINNQTFTGDGTSGIYVWGIQVEAGAFATSYIPTTTIPLTRNADVAVMTGTNFSNWYNAAQGTFRVDASTPASGTRSLISADDNTSGNSIVMSTVGTAPKLVVTQSSTEQANVAAGTITANTAMSAYASYAANYFGIARPSARQVDTSGTVPTVDRLRIGADQAGNYANGIIQAIQYWP